MIRVILAIVRVSAKYCRQSPEGLPQPGDLAEGESGSKPGGLRQGYFALTT